MEVVSNRKMMVKVKWNEATEQWRLRHLSGSDLQEIFNCETAIFLTQDLDKAVEYYAEIDIKFKKIKG